MFTFAVSYIVAVVSDKVYLPNVTACVFAAGVLVYPAAILFGRVAILCESDHQ
jgi:hypothetical protein